MVYADVRCALDNGLLRMVYPGLYGLLLKNKKEEKDNGKESNGTRISNRKGT